jgi:nucleoside-diphosphate-sugar epimerase
MPRCAIVTGATSQIGVFLIPRLLQLGWCVDAISRNPQRTIDVAHLRWALGDLGTARLPQTRAPVDMVFHLAALPLLPRHLPDLAARGAGRVIAISSTSRLTKVDSPSPYERQVAAGLARAEQELAETCDAMGLAWTVFRPTMIYGAGLDQNVAAITRWIRRFRFFPLINHGVGLRQPVHADDLAQACIAAVDAERAFGRAFELGGGEQLSYREMVRRVFDTQGIRPRFAPLPAWALRALIRCLNLLPRYRHLTPAMVDRMATDLCFDTLPADQAFGYQPRPFLPDSMQP